MQKSFKCQHLAHSKYGALLFGGESQVSDENSALHKT
jgi:hypothetical protein